MPVSVRKCPFSTEDLVHEWLDNFLTIVTKGDNIPIVAMLFIVAFFLGWGAREARRNDKLIEQGKRDQILKDMQR